MVSRGGVVRVLVWGRWIEDEMVLRYAVPVLGVHHGYDGGGDDGDGFCDR